MDDQSLPVQEQNPQQVPQENKGILGLTLGELLQNNTHAQGMVMKAMQITPQQFQQMLQATGNNQLMNQSIGDLFKSGIVQQAVTMQGGKLTPEQSQQIAQAMQQQGQQPVQPATTPEDKVPYVMPQKQSFLQKLQNFFK